jgi:peptidoglycan/xylan/chitin deacetylase (PgdA/CDA1 family)
LTGEPGSFFRQSSAQNSTPLIRAVAGSLGYRTCLSYDIDGLDWMDPSVATVRQAVATASAGSVVSLHLGHPVTIAALPGILDDLTARGLAPVTASRLLRP